MPLLASRSRSRRAAQHSAVAEAVAEARLAQRAERRRETARAAWALALRPRNRARQAAPAVHSQQHAAAPAPPALGRRRAGCCPHLRSPPAAVAASRRAALRFHRTSLSRALHARYSQARQAALRHIRAAAALDALRCPHGGAPRPPRAAQHAAACAASRRSPAASAQASNARGRGGEWPQAGRTCKTAASPHSARLSCSRRVVLRCP